MVWDAGDSRCKLITVATRATVPDSSEEGGSLATGASLDNAWLDGGGAAGAPNGAASAATVSGVPLRRAARGKGGEAAASGWAAAGGWQQQE